MKFATNGGIEMVCLNTLSTNLANLMNSASTIQRQDTILSVCHEAITEIGDVSPLIHRVLSQGATGRALRTQIEELRDKLDDRYFDAQEKAEEERSSSDAALKLFSEARLAAALALTMRPLDAATACEALYEALMALQDNRPTVRRLELTLL